MKSKVYFTDMRSKHKRSLLDKTRMLFKKAGFPGLIEEGDLVAIKLHWCEPGNIAFLPPPIVRVVVDQIKEAGGKPFLTDANTLYNGRRRNAVDHIESALKNGFSYETVGAPIIVADGLRGHDFVNVPVGGEHFDEVKIASCVHNADVLIALSHVKGHELFGFGGALKNVGMGCAAPAGKQMLHSDVKPRVDPAGCTGCGICIDRCPVDAITITPEKKAFIDENTCYGCGECTVFCPTGTIPVNWESSEQKVQEKTAEYVAGVVRHKAGKCGFMNFIMNVSPDCDCAPWNDVPIVPNLGMMASTDPVAIDQASVDLINESPGMAGSALSDPNSKDKFADVHSGRKWHYTLEHAERMKVGARDYELVKFWIQD